MSNIRILLADDDVEDRMIISDAFREIGVADDVVHYVENGEEVLTWLHKANDPLGFPSLIVLDLNMPKMSGRKTLEELKRDIRYKDIKVIIFSTSINEREKAECIALGALSYITKPLKYTESLETAEHFNKQSLV